MGHSKAQYKDQQWERTQPLQAGPKALSRASCSPSSRAVWTSTLLPCPRSQKYLIKTGICKMLSAGGVWTDLCTVCLKASKSEFSHSAKKEMKLKLLSDLLKTEKGAHTGPWKRLWNSWSAFHGMNPFWMAHRACDALLLRWGQLQLQPKGRSVQLYFS